MKRVVAVLAVLLASCGSYDNKCEPGRQVECYCAGGVPGFQRCLEDGSGWGECECCEEDCAGKCCGDDGCGGTCGDNCPSGYACNDLSCECEPERECETNADCPVGYWCDRTVWECKEIECIPNCTGKCCGSDGCDGTCPNNCPTGYICNSLTCWCELEQVCPPGEVLCGNECVNLLTDEDNCGQCDNACGILAYCDNGFCACGYPYTDCYGMCVDLDTDPNHCGACGASCVPGRDCHDGACVEPCCPGSPAGEYFIDVDGTVVDVSIGQGVMVALAPISPMDALTNPNPTHLDELVSGASGAFQTDCFEVTEVALGCVMLADDVSFDGTAGAYFPTGTVVKTWNTNSEKWCVDVARVFAVPTVLVAGLDQLPDLDSAAEGFVMGLVVDQSGNPVEGAVVTLSDGSDLDKVYYPNADFSDLVTGPATSSNGIYVLPGVNFSMGIIQITAEKTGMIFEAENVAPKAGFCYFVVLQEEA